MVCKNCDTCDCVCGERKKSRSSSFSKNIEYIISNLVDNSIDDSDILVCDNCNSTFKNKQTLNLHKKTSEKCSKQDDNNSNFNKICNYCNKNFSSKQMKKYHEAKCVNKIIFEVSKEYEKKIKDIHNHYQEIIKKMSYEVTDTSIRK
jgi:hypothetical protein